MGPWSFIVVLIAFCCDLLVLDFSLRCYSFRKTNAETALYQTIFLSLFTSFQAPFIFQLLTSRIFLNVWHCLSFSAQKVTPWNTKRLQEAIRNGADIHPGATHFRDNNSMYKLQAVPAKRRSIAKMLPASRGSICQPGRDPNCEFESKVVYRHLQDGDIVLVNRQVCLYYRSSYSWLVISEFSPAAP